MASVTWSHDKANMTGKNVSGGEIFLLKKLCFRERVGWSSPLGLSKEGELWAGKRSRHKGMELFSCWGGSWQKGPRGGCAYTGGTVRFPWGQAPASDAGKQMSTVTGVVSIDSLRPASQSRASREPVRAGPPGG